MTATQSAPEHAWDALMPLLTNRFFLYDGGKLLAWTGAIMAALMAAMFAATGNSFETLLKVYAVLALVLAGFGLLFLLIAWLFFGGRYGARFRVGPQGIAWETLSRRARLGNRAAIVAGALAASASTAGAGLLAVSEESGLITWDEIGRVRKYRDLRVLTIMNGWRVVVRLYCTPENYGYVEQLVDYYLRAREAR